MPDYGARVANHAITTVDRKLRRTYKKAQQELEGKLADFNKRFAAKDAMKQELLAAGKITADDYKNWLSGQVFMRGQWQSKINEVTQVLYHHNEEAAAIVHEHKLDVFAENYNYEAYITETTLGQVATNEGISFDIYNTQAVARLTEHSPQVLPRWKVDEEKDYAWNYKKVNNIVKQGIIQGESIDQITGRLCKDLCTQNENRMRTFARTAITGAQNAGRQQQMNDAAGLGLEVHKQWLATLDGRTRDAHRQLDGQEVPYNEPFQSDLGEIEYPGDPSAAPANVYNCRCTMVSIYPKYEDRSKPSWRDSETVLGYSYQDWKDGKGKEQKIKRVSAGSLQSRRKRAKIRVLEDATSFPTETAEAVKDLKRIKGKHTREADCKATNPKYLEDTIWMNNCQRCVTTYEARRRGYDVTAQPLIGDVLNDAYARNSRYDKFYQCGTRISQNIYRTAGLDRNDLSTDKIVSAIQSMMDGYGNGSRAIIEGYWHDGKGDDIGHVFIAENIGGKVHFIDPQSGNMNYKGIGKMEPRFMRIFRIDDLPFSENIKDAVKNND